MSSDETISSKLSRGEDHVEYVDAVLLVDRLGARRERPCARASGCRWRSRASSWLAAMRPRSSESFSLAKLYCSIAISRRMSSASICALMRLASARFWAAVVGVRDRRREGADQEDGEKGKKDRPEMPAMHAIASFADSSCLSRAREVSAVVRSSLSGLGTRLLQARGFGHLSTSAWAPQPAGLVCGRLVLEVRASRARPFTRHDPGCGRAGGPPRARRGRRLRLCPWARRPRPGRRRSRGCDPAAWRRASPSRPCRAAPPWCAPSSGKVATPMLTESASWLGAIQVSATCCRMRWATSKAPRASVSSRTTTNSSPP